jgi:hypothetical protein
MRLIKNIMFQMVMFNIMLIINKYLLIYLDILYINTLWGMICIWVLSDTLIVNMDMKNLETNYNELKDRHKLISSEFILNIKNKYNQLNLISKILAEYIITNNDIKNEMLIITKLISPIETPNSLLSPILETTKSNITIKPLIKEII